MTEIYEADTRQEVWVLATKPLLDGSHKQNIILHVNNPGIDHDLKEDLCEELDDHYDNADMDPINTISETIFPAWLYRDKGYSLDKVYSEYADQIDIITERSRGYSWGTYFERMIRRKKPDKDEYFNPLQNTIDKLKRANSPGGHPFKSVYEINLHGITSDIALYDDNSDGARTRNMPCLSHLSFNLFDGTLHITAFYRSHDYRFKVIGNLRGLAHLQHCVAKEVDAELGQLVVHSSKATVTDKAPKGEFREIVEKYWRKMNNESVTDF